MITQSKIYNVDVPEERNMISHIILDTYIQVKQGDIFGLEVFENNIVTYLRNQNSACLHPRSLMFGIRTTDDTSQKNKSAVGRKPGHKAVFYGIKKADALLPYCRKYAVQANVVYPSIQESKYTCCVVQ